MWSVYSDRRLRGLGEGAGQRAPGTLGTLSEGRGRLFPGGQGDDRPAVAEGESAGEVTRMGIWGVGSGDPEGRRRRLAEWAQPGRPGPQAGRTLWELCLREARPAL